MHPVRTVLAPGTAGADSLASRLAGLNSTETDWHQHRRGAGLGQNHPVPASEDAGLSGVGPSQGCLDYGDPVSGPVLVGGGGATVRSRCLPA